MRYVGVASLSAGVLLLELTLTRVYSVTQGYHFAFLAVSLGLLGFGTSGTLLFLAPRLWRGGGRFLLASSAGLFSLTAVGSYWALDVIPFDAYLLVVEPSMFAYLALFYLVPAVPFLFAGLALGGALSMAPGRAARLYGASLTGSGIGALLALGGPAANGPGDALAAVSLLGAAALLAFSVGAGVTRMAAAAAASMALAAAGLVLPQVVELEMSQYKTLPRVLDQVGSTLEWTGWNAFSRVDFVSADALHQAPGLSFAFSGALPRQSAMTSDGDNLTSLTASSPADAEFTAFLPGAVAYRLVESPRVLVIEPGGGLDVLTALHHGAREVVAVVGNPLEAELLRGRAAEAAGRVFESPQVTVVQTNPRTYLARHDDRFDVVVVSLRDAFRPITAGAYSLSENYLYTTEAFRDYVEHLVPNGVLVVTRWAQLPPSEEMRAAAGLIEAIEDGRRTDAGDSLAAIRTLQTLTVVAKNGVFSAGELQRIREFAESRRMDLAYLPDLRDEEANRFFVLEDASYLDGLTRLLDKERRGDYYDSRQFDVRPTSDDRPFFFHLFRWRQTPDVVARLGSEWQPFGGAGYLVVVAFLAVAVASSTLLILGPLLLRRPDASGGGVGAVPAWRPLVYFVGLGLAFLWIELPLMQRFILVLDHPTYSFGLVLFTLLVFSGVGSLLSPRLGRLRAWTAPALGCAAIAYAVGVGSAVEAILQLPFAARVFLAALLLAPLGLLMGMPFPVGVEALRRTRPDLIPWAWGANGYASVVGSIMATLLALSWGFSWVIAAGGAAYFVAAAAYAPALLGVTPSRAERI